MGKLSIRNVIVIAVALLVLGLITLIANQNEDHEEDIKAEAIIENTWRGSSTEDKILICNEWKFDRDNVLHQFDLMRSSASPIQDKHLEKFFDEKCN